ncbi:hypothetical protein CPAV1605_967 [seawater metagenome]|uniref:Uncharacterized protein n=1 Tax=seawater metagenome TaxID=1561972 RepID=A0A5E8CM13_9ZZZZ
MWKLVEDKNEIIKILNSNWYGIDKFLKEYVHVKILNPPKNFQQVNKEFKLEIHRSDIQKPIDGTLALTIKGNFLSKIEHANFDIFNSNPEYNFNISLYKNNNNVDLLSSSDSTYIKLDFINNGSNSVLPITFFKIVFNQDQPYTPVNLLVYLEKLYPSVNLLDFEKNLDNGKLKVIEYFGLDKEDKIYTIHIIENNQIHAHYCDAKGVIIFAENTRIPIEITIIGDNVHKIVRPSDQYPKVYKFFVISEDDNVKIIAKLNLMTGKVRLIKYYKA